MTTEVPPVLILVNPKSGGGLAGELVPHLAGELQRQGFSLELFESSGPGEIRARVGSIRKPLSALVVIGGDGTVREAVAGEPGPELPIAVLPTGTGNVLANELRLPKKPRETAGMIRRGRTKVVDLGLLWQLSHDASPEGRKAGGEPFLLMVGAGIDGTIVEEVHRRRAGGTLGKLRYLGPILGSLCRFRPVKIFLVLENGERMGPFAQVIVTNVKSYGGFWKMPGDIRMDDGLLDCIGLEAGGVLGLIRHGILGSMNLLREGSRVFRTQGIKVRLVSEGRSLVQADGEPAGACPVEIELRPKAVRFFLP